MGKQLVIVSDLSGRQVEETEHITIIVRSHPALDAPVRLDAGLDELNTISTSATDYVLIEVHAQGGSETRLVEVEDFDKLFKGDAKLVLTQAEPLGRPKPGSTSSTAKREPEELNTIRAWAKANGWPDISDRGRIPQVVEQAYMARAT